jgi:prophage regulatory protein
MKTTKAKAGDKAIWREWDVLAQLSVSRKTLRLWEASGNFPRRRQLGPRSIGWLRSEILEWCRSRPCVAPHDDVSR